MSDATGSWQPDPNGRHQYRYWDGSQWTDQVANDGVTTVDAPDPGSPPPADVAPADVASTEAAEPAVESSAPTEPTPSVEPTAPVEPAAAAMPPPEPTASTWGAPPTDPGATTSMPVAGGTVPPGAMPPTGTPPPSEPPSKKSSNKPALIIGGVLLLVLLGAGAFLLFGGDDDTREQLISAMVDDGFDREQAECIVDGSAEELGMDRLGELDSGATPTAAEQATVGTVTIECGIEEAADEIEDELDEETDDTTEDTPDASDITGSDALMDLFIQGVMSESDLTEEQARCFSEEFLENSGIDMAEMMEDPDSMATNPDVLASMLEIFSTCGIDLDAMGTGPGGGTSGFSSGDGYGDDPELDALWDGCEGGDMGACDDLWLESPLDSAYEEFGGTCGGRETVSTYGGCEE